jgi:hypothetical protein
LARNLVERSACSDGRITRRLNRQAVCVSFAVLPGPRCLGVWGAGCIAPGKSVIVGSARTPVLYAV